MTLSFAEFKRRVGEDLSEGYWLFRGQSSCDWKLASTYHRWMTRLGREVTLGPFATLLEQFTSDASDFLGEDLAALSNAQRVALAQHHGLPTPLLDWSESPYVATFFALTDKVREQRGGPFRIWALRSDTLPRATEIPDPGAGNDGFFVLRTRLFQSRRLLRQRGLFTFHGFTDYHLGDYLHRVYGNGHQLRVYDVEAANPADIATELRMMGLTAAVLLDSMDGVAFDVLSHLRI